MNYLSQSKTNYLHRSCVILSISSCAKSLNSNQINEHIIPNLLKNIKDKIPNVRLMVMKTLQTVLQYTDSTGKDKIKSTAKDLKNDDDLDVKFIANKIIS